jgi:hypothetical protein
MASNLALPIAELRAFNGNDNLEIAHLDQTKGAVQLVGLRLRHCASPSATPKGPAKRQPKCLLGLKIRIARAGARASVGTALAMCRHGWR